MGFYQFCKQLQQIKPGARIILLTDIENMSSKMKSHGNKKKNFQTYSGFYGVADYDKWEYAYLTAIEEFRFDVGYIKKPIKNYGHVASKLNQLLITGTYQVEKIYGDPKEERKAKSKKAFNKIMALEVYPGGFFARTPDFRFFKLSLDAYGKDITEIEHAEGIVKRLRSYESDAKRELEAIQKPIREWEDRFPSVVEDPAAFAVAQEKKGRAEGGEEEKK